MQNTPEEDRDVLSLDEHKLSIEHDTVLSDGTIEQLIRDGKITATMATSLMNDLSFARSVIWNLTDMGKAVFGAKDIEVHEAEDLLSLTEDDVDEIDGSDEPDPIPHSTA